MTMHAETRRALIAALVCFLVLAAPALAQSTAQPPPETSDAASDERSRYVDALLSAVREHPSLRAARAGVTAAERRLAGVRQPVELQIDATWTRLTVEDDPTGAIEQPDPQASISATAHPFLYGDLADLEAQRVDELARARLSLAEAQAQLETQAIDTAGSVILAGEALALAERSLALAERSVVIAEERLARGAARPADVTRAQQEAARAAAEVAAAADRLDLARRSLASFTGGGDLPEMPDRLPEMPRAEGTSPGVTRAELDLALAHVGLGAARRNLYPVGQASYTYNFDENRGTLTASLESRTLSPSLTYRTGSSSSGTGGSGGTPPSAFADLAPMQAMPDPPRVAGNFTIGVSVTLSPERFQAVDAASERVTAAEAGLEAARLRAELDDASLTNAIHAAERELMLATTSVELARNDREDVARRVELGLATELDLLRAELDLERASLSLLQARQELRRAHLNSYTNAALPVSEVLP